MKFLLKILDVVLGVAIAIDRWADKRPRAPKKK